jgi:hypothetical protein
MWVHLKASISLEAESHDATQICRAAAEILHGQTPFQYHLTARFWDAAPAWKKKIENLERKAWQTLRILDATLAILHVGGIRTGHR